jgi:hypothetical protein
MDGGADQIDRLGRATHTIAGAAVATARYSSRLLDQPHWQRCLAGPRSRRGTTSNRTRIARTRNRLSAVTRSTCLTWPLGLTSRWPLRTWLILTARARAIDGCELASAPGQNSPHPVSWQLP